MKTIRFSENWNNKLESNYFTTIRLYTKEKFEYYYNLFEKKEEVCILLKGKEKCSSKIVDMEVRLLRDIPDFCKIVDTGTDVLTFDTLMEAMYNKKSEWQGNFTRMIILCLKVVHRI